MSRTRNRSLHGLRGAAVLLVITMHLLQMGAKVGLVTLPTEPWVATAIEHIGPLGVVLFFMISGYLITDSLIRHGQVTSFLRSRALRLYPVFVPMHLLMFLVGPVVGYEWMSGLFGRPAQYLRDFVSNLLFLPGMFPLPLAQKNAWSLSYELVWYLLAALTFTAMALRRSAGARAVLGVALVVLAGVALIAVSVVRLPFAWFLVGAGIYALQVRGGEKLARWPRWGLVTTVSAAVVAVTYLVDPLLALLPSVPLFLGVVLGGGPGAPGSGPARLLGSRSLQWLGTISYSFYLVHPFVLEIVRRVAAHAIGVVPSPLPFLAFVVIGVTAALAGGWLVHRYLEVALTRWLDDRLPGRPQPVTPQPRASRTA